MSAGPPPPLHHHPLPLPGFAAASPVCVRGGQGAPFLLPRPDWCHHCAPVPFAVTVPLCCFLCLGMALPTTLLLFQPISAHLSVSRASLQFQPGCAGPHTAPQESCLQPGGKADASREQLRSCSVVFLIYSFTNYREIVECLLHAIHSARVSGDQMGLSSPSTEVENEKKTFHWW